MMLVVTHLVRTRLLPLSLCRIPAVGAFSLFLGNRNKSVRCGNLLSAIVADLHGAIFFSCGAMQPCIAPYVLQMTLADLRGSIFFPNGAMQPCMAPYVLQMTLADLRGSICFQNGAMQSCMAPYVLQMTLAAPYFFQMVLCRLAFR